MKLKEPYVILLIGPPLSGKSTWVNNSKLDAITISRDSIVLELHGTDNYDKAFTEVNHKRVDEILIDRIRSANEANINVIIDMTNLSTKRRKYTLSLFSKAYYKVGVVFPILDSKEYERRNESRMNSDNKTISKKLLESMIGSYKPICDNEGFDKIITL